jgi:hypothetical protein
MNVHSRPEPESQPRPRAILVFTEDDLSRPPIVYVTGGSYEQDEAIRREILRRWGAIA